MKNKKIKILISPASYDGRKIFRKLRNNKRYDIKGFIDNDKKKKYLYKQKVFHISKLKNLDYDKIITGGRYFAEVCSALKKKKIPQEKITILPKKKFDYSKKELLIRSFKTHKILKKFVEIVEKRKIDYLLDASSILAVIRKVSLAKFSDVDILMDSQFKNLFLKEIKKIKNVIIKKDFIKIRKRIILKRVIILSKKKSFFEEPCVFDIAFFWNDGLKYYKYFVNKKTYLPNYIFEGSFKIKYKNFNLSIPKNYKKYMKSLFGNKWIKPDDYFQEKQHFKGLFTKTFFKNFL